ncbi:MAG: CoA pyrophosphatase [Actinomycetota bacterium]|nr:MAG: CoA pyrophosphatase [Actinomycetota bacterium]
MSWPGALPHDDPDRGWVAPGARQRVPDWFLPLLDVADQVTAADLALHSWTAASRQGAVLILVGDGPAGPDVLLLQRAATMRTHAGQPAFPGGAMDPDDDGVIATALREAVEETGLEPAGVDVVATLPQLYLPPSSFVVIPVLAWWRDPSPIRAASAAEVASVHRVAVAELADPANRLQVRHPAGFTSPGFRVQGLLVWGFTAGILDRLLDLSGWAQPWDESSVVDLPIGR